MPSEHECIELRTQLSDRRAGEATLTGRVNAINERMLEIIIEMNLIKKILLALVVLTVGKDKAVDILGNLFK